MIAQYISRPFWIERLEAAWKKRPIVWLMGMRRTGKTTLSMMLSSAHYYNCDLPSVSRALADGEQFLSSISSDKETTLIIDEIHRLADPTSLLKIAADQYKNIRILATGSSTLGATTKFSDTLTGRKADLFFPPVLWHETSKNFSIKNIQQRLQRGGLPELLTTTDYEPNFYSEWIDSFYARDIIELFSIRNRTGFMTCFRLLLRRSGNFLEETAFSQESGISRPTFKSYLESLQAANAIFLLPPFHGGGKRELIKRPKVYVFDTGFVAYENGWDTLREHEQGILWEHLVLDTLRVVFPRNSIYYWHDKSGREIDFVIKHNREPIAIECKMNPDHFNCSNLKEFRSLYPEGANLVVSPNIERQYTRKINNMEITFCNTGYLLEKFLI